MTHNGLQRVADQVRFTGLWTKPLNPEITQSLRQLQLFGLQLGNSRFTSKTGCRGDTCKTPLCV